MKKLLPYLAAVISGLLLAMCYPGFEVASGLVWIWPIPMMAALWLGGGEKKRKRFGWRVAGLAGLTFWLVNVKWLIAMGDLETVPVAGAMAGWFILSVYLSLYFALWGIFATTIGNPWRKREEQTRSSIEEKMQAKLAKDKPKKRDRGILASLRVMRFAIMHASFWVVLEWLRGWVMTGFGWNGLGVAFHEVPVMMQVADLVGVTGIAFFPMLLASVILQTGKRLIDEVRAGKFQAHLEIGLSMGVVAAVFAYGVNRMTYHANQPSHDVKVLIVQENIPQSLKWDELLEAEHYMGYVESVKAKLAEIEEENQQKMEQAMLSGEVVELDYPDLLVLPESAMTQPLLYTGDQEQYHFSPLTWDFFAEQMYKENHFKIVFGSNVVGAKISEGGLEYDFDKPIYNGIAVASPSLVSEEQEADSLIVHGKNHLVPFGEYVPEIPFLAGITEFFSGMSYGENFSKGGSFEPLQVKMKGELVQLIPSVCFEDTVGRVNRKFVRPEQQMLVNITNDGWFGESSASKQHMANAKFRAVELRRPMARAANTGVSGIVSVIGSLNDSGSDKVNMIGTPENSFVKGALFATVKVPEAGHMTLYARFGDWFVGLCAIMLIGLAFVPQR